MLFEFKVGNYISIKEQRCLTKLTGNIRGDHNCIRIGMGSKSILLLKSSVLLGADTSNKGDYLKALHFMSKFVLNKYKIIQSTDSIPFEPFLFDLESKNSPSVFSIEFFYKNTKYRYGFSINNLRIIEEYLFCAKKRKESLLFYRNTITEELDRLGKDFKEGSFFFKNHFKFSENRLLLWGCDQRGPGISTDILNWFTKINCLTALGESNINPKLAPSLRNLGLTHLKDIKHTSYGIKILYDSCSLYLKQESNGTQLTFNILNQVLNSIDDGELLILEDVNLHTNFILYLMELFNGNKNGAQLILTTSNTGILTSDQLRRDQIWFAENNKQGASDLYSLIAFEKRKHIHRDYLIGRFGGIPWT